VVPPATNDTTPNHNRFHSPSTHQRYGGGEAH
jgi:hypothetical protein